MTKKELMTKVKELGLDKDRRNAVVCGIIGHSKIVTMCFGYVYCGRCEAQIGDRLGGFFDLTQHVIVGHGCEECKNNLKSLTWKDKLYVKPPL